jgi:hypothetical protein
MFGHGRQGVHVDHGKDFQQPLAGLIVLWLCHVNPVLD